MSGINPDVSDRKQVEVALRQSEAALRQSQARLHLAADEGRLTYAEFDMGTGQITSAENFEAVMGYRAASASGPTDKRAMLSRRLSMSRPTTVTGSGRGRRNTSSDDRATGSNTVCSATMASNAGSPASGTLRPAPAAISVGNVEGTQFEDPGGRVLVVEDNSI